MINKDIIKLGNAIAEYEGWIPNNNNKSERLESSISYRHHNPGNLRHSIFEIGNKNGFAYFENDTIGLCALYYDLAQKARGNTVTKLGPKSTIKELLEVYAPKIENDTDCYIDFIEMRTGFKRDETLDRFLIK